MVCSCSGERWSSGQTYTEGKAEELTMKLGHMDFCAAEGWLNRWKKRENMMWSSLKGEAGEANKRNISPCTRVGYLCN